MLDITDNKGFPLIRLLDCGGVAIREHFHLIVEPRLHQDNVGTKAREFWNLLDFRVTQPQILQKGAFETVMIEARLQQKSGTGQILLECS